MRRTRSCRARRVQRQLFCLVRVSAMAHHWWPSACEPTGHTTPYKADWGGGSSGACTTLECDAGVNTGVIGVGGAATADRLALDVAAVQDWQPQSKFCAAGADTVLTVDPADGACEFPPVVDPALTAIESIVEVEPHVMLFPDDPKSMGSYAEQPRHHTVTNAVRSAVSRARGDRERRILLGR